MRALVTRYQDAIFGLCYRMLGQREDAEDVAQETFLRAFRSLHRWDSQRSFKPWLLTIAANRCRTLLGRRPRTPIACESVVHLVPPEQPAADRADLAEELQLAIEQLRPDYRLCFVMFHQQELSCAEIAQVMECPEGTIKTWLHRARRELADFLMRRGVTCDVLPQLH